VREISKEEIVTGKIMKFKIPEEFELNNSYEVKKQVYENAFKKGYNYILLDFSETKYMDSTGLGTIIALHKQALMKAGAAAFINFDENIKKLLKMTALDRILNIFDSEEEAIKFLDK